MDEQPGKGARTGWPDASSASTPETVRAWFTRPPYPGAWAGLGVAALLLLEAAVLHRFWQPQPPPVVVAEQPAAPVPPPAAVVPPAGVPARAPVEAPRVTVRDLPVKQPPHPHPSVSGAPDTPAAAASPAITPPLEQTAPDEPSVFPQAPGAPAAPSGSPVVPDMGGGPAHGAVRAPGREAPEPAPPVVTRPRAPEPAAARSTPSRRRTGVLTLYFDADSSTFAHHHERLPLRVEVYVDGVKRLVTDDPEKHQFEVARLPEGRHGVRIVPFVGDYPAEPREEVIDIAPGEVSDYKAVLRKSHDTSRVAKFQPRD